MADIIVKPGVRFLNNVGSFTVNDNKTGMVAFTGVFATSYGIEISMSSNDTRGGAGNALIFRSYSDRTVGVTLTVQEWNLDYVAASVGSPIEYGLSELFIIEEQFDVDASGFITLEEPATGPISIKLPNGSRIGASASVTNTVDLSAYDVEGECVSVTYPFSANAKSVLITSDKSPYIGRLVLQGTISDSLVGIVGTVSVDIPSFAFDGNMTINMNADGTTSTTQIVGTALAVDGTKCTDGKVYGYVREYVESDPAPHLAYIAASPSPIELDSTAPETQLIAVIGYRGGMFSSIGILNSDCTFISDTIAVATVDATGLITAVSAGTAEITVTHTASGLEDIIEVTVV